MKKETIYRICRKWLLIFLGVMLLFTLVTRVLDTMTIPQVTTGKSKQGVIQYLESGTGTLEAEEILNVPVMSGLSVRRIAAAVGVPIQAGSPLFAYQMDLLEERYEECLAELEKLKISLEAEVLDNRPLPAMTEEELAQQALAKEQRSLGEAEKDWTVAQQEYTAEIEKIENRFAKDQTKSAEELLNERYETYVAAEQAYDMAILEEKTAITEAERAVRDAEDKLEAAEAGGNAEEIKAAKTAVSRAKQDVRLAEGIWSIKVDQAHEAMLKAYQEYMAVQKGENDTAATLREEYETKKKEEETGYNTALKSWQEAQFAYNDALLDLENARKKDSYAGVAQQREQEASRLRQRSIELDIQAKQEEADRLKALIDQEGITVSPFSGILTACKVTPGTALTGSEEVKIGTGQLLLKGEITKEMAGYLTAGDKVVLKKGGQTTGLTGTVRSVEIDEENNKAVLTAEAGGKGLLPGNQLEFTCEARSPIYYNTIPIDALYKDNTSDYVLVVQERNSIIGTQTVAVRVNVTVLAKSKDTAAIEGAVSSEDKIIISSTASIEDGSRVRVTGAE